jgi:hypothetical protein
MTVSRPQTRKPTTNQPRIPCLASWRIHGFIHRFNLFNEDYLTRDSSELLNDYRLMVTFMTDIKRSIVLSRVGTDSN